MGALGGNNNKIVVDLSNVKETQFITLTEGSIYTGEITKAEQTVSQKGNPMIKWGIKIETEDGISNVTHFTGLTTDSLWALKQFLRAVAPDMDLDTQLELDLPSFLGAKIRFIAGNREYNGNIYSTLKTPLPPEEAGEEDLV